MKKIYESPDGAIQISTNIEGFKWPTREEKIAGLQVEPSFRDGVEAGVSAGFNAAVASVRKWATELAGTEAGIRLRTAGNDLERNRERLVATAIRALAPIREGEA